MKKLIIFCLLAACGSTSLNSSALVGSWNCSFTNQIWTYNNDNTVSMTSVCYLGHGKYALDGTTLTITGMPHASETQPCNLYNGNPDPFIQPITFVSSTSYRFTSDPDTSHTCTKK